MAFYLTLKGSLQLCTWWLRQDLRKGLDPLLAGRKVRKSQMNLKAQSHRNYHCKGSDDYRCLRECRYLWTILVTNRILWADSFVPTTSLYLGTWEQQGRCPQPILSSEQNQHNLLELCFTTMF